MPKHYKTKTPGTSSYLKAMKEHQAALRKKKDKKVVKVIRGRTERKSQTPKRKIV